MQRYRLLKADGSDCAPRRVAPSRPLISFPRQERDEIRHAFQQHILIDLHRAAALPRDLDAPVKVSGLVTLPLSLALMFSLTPLSAACALRACARVHVRAAARPGVGGGQNLLKRPRRPTADWLAQSLLPRSRPSRGDDGERPHDPAKAFGTTAEAGSSTSTTAASLRWPGPWLSADTRGREI